MNCLLSPANPFDHLDLLRAALSMRENQSKGYTLDDVMPLLTDGTHIFLKNPDEDDIAVISIQVLDNGDVELWINMLYATSRKRLLMAYSIQFYEFAREIKAKTIHWESGRTGFLHLAKANNFELTKTGQSYVYELPINT